MLLESSSFWTIGPKSLTPWGGENFQQKNWKMSLLAFLRETLSFWTINNYKWSQLGHRERWHLDRNSKLKKQINSKQAAESSWSRSSSCSRSGATTLSFATVSPICLVSTLYLNFLYCGGLHDLSSSSEFFSKFTSKLYGIAMPAIPCSMRSPHIISTLANILQLFWIMPDSFCFAFS